MALSSVEGFNIRSSCSSLAFEEFGDSSCKTVLVYIRPIELVWHNASVQLLFSQFSSDTDICSTV